MISSPPPNQSSEKARFVHAFGYHLAKKMLGVRRTNECILRAHHQQQQHNADDPSADVFRCFRSNWRSNPRFPWHLPEPIGRDSTSLDFSNLDTEALFVDITFDFVVFPTEIVDGGMTDSCYVLKEDDVRRECTDGGQEGEMMSVEADSCAVAVAVRIGALVGIPSTSYTTNADNGCDGVGGGGAKSMSTCQYKYQRGNKALTVSDLVDHCRSIDIVLEEMDPADVAHIIGDAFMEGCNGSSWQVMAKHVDSRATARSDSPKSTDKSIISMSEWATNELQWHMKLHYGSLQADGCLPLSSNGDDTPVYVIDRCILDMILLQSNHGRDGNVYTPVPISDALMVWKSIDPSIVSAVEKPVGPSPRKLSPPRKATVLVEQVSDMRYSTMENLAPRERKDDKSETIGKPKSTVRRPPKSHETALFTRGTSTTVGGSRKKPKFRLAES